MVKGKKANGKRSAEKITTEKGNRTDGGGGAENWATEIRGWPIKTPHLLRTNILNQIAGYFHIIIISGTFSYLVLIVTVSSVAYFN